MSDPSAPKREPGPVHMGPTSARWSTVNAAEALPGVIRPLTYTFYFPATERASARFWKDLGLLERSAPDVPDSPDLRFFGVFHGRMAINIDRYGAMADRTPGTSAVALEEQMFGVARTGLEEGGTRRRYPIVVLRAPWTVFRARRETLRVADEVARWRRTSLTRLATGDPAVARDLFREALRRMEVHLYRHIMLTAVAQGCYEAAGKLARSAGRPDVELDLVASASGTEEAQMVEALRDVAQGRSTMESFLDTYGFHGPDEGHLSGVVWRHDPRPVEVLLERYRDADSRRDALADERRRSERVARVAEFVASLPRLRRPGARLLLRAASAMPALRELGKGQFLRVTDVAREASVVLGAHLTETGVLQRHEDVFFLTAPELLGDEPMSVDTVAHRRTEHEEFLTTGLPSTWTGEPSVVPLAARDDNRTPAGTVVTGIGVSAGTCTGRVRVVDDPSADEFDVDDVLVCSITDPSWASIMAIAGAVVIDVGGTISHGAIVSRELGIPCVVSTGDGTLRLHDGDEVVVDGAAGTVTVITPA